MTKPEINLIDVESELINIEGLVEVLATIGDKRGDGPPNYARACDYLK